MIYLPKRFNNEHLLQSLDLIRSYPLATVITCHEDAPWISPLPLVLEIEEDRMILYGHLARANPHSNLLGGRQTTVVFMGPQTYISPTWYSENDVPTWNYMTVHMRGQCEMISDFPGIVNCLKKLTDFMEGQREPAWQFWLPPDLQEDTLEKHIVGFKIEVEDMQAKFKLSQNRSEADLAGVLHGLAAQKDDMSQAILKQMKSLK